MAKRFSCTEKWKKVWFRKMPSKHKCFWLYILDNCNHAGIWEVDFELASFMIGEPIGEGIKDSIENHIDIIDNGKKWFIRDFITFQYGKLNDNNNAHISVLKILNQYKLNPYPGAKKPLKQKVSGAMDMDKDKDKEMVKDKDKEDIKKVFFFLKNDEFSSIFDKFVKMRKSIKKPITEHGIEILLSRLQKKDIKIAITMLENSVVNSWQGVFDLKDNQNNSGFTKTQQKTITSMQKLEARLKMEAENEPQRV